ncbi:hypothetical protein VAWG004_07960 [Aeromonas veronii]|nr:hypothetical protein VAWG004_07960 [Aeromonas veronii]
MTIFQRISLTKKEDVSGLRRFDVCGMQQNGCFDALPVSKVTGRACGVASKGGQRE